MHAGNDAMVATVRDIPDRRGAESALRGSKAKLLKSGRGDALLGPPGLRCLHPVGTFISRARSPQGIASAPSSGISVFFTCSLPLT